MSLNPDQIDRIYIENALELLDEPGEWYLDRPAKTVYYMPRHGRRHDQGRGDRAGRGETRRAARHARSARAQHPLRGHHVRARQLAVAEQDRLCRCAGELRPGLEESVQTQGRADRRAQRGAQEPVERRLPRGQVVRFERCTFTKLGSGGIDLEFGCPGQRDRRAAGSTTSRARPFKWATCSRTTTIPTTRARSSRTTPW